MERARVPDLSGDHLLQWVNGRLLPRFNRVEVVAIIFRRSNDDEKRILLLKRYETDPYNPGLFEPPNGAVEYIDRTIRHAFAREVKEQTDLNVVSLVTALDSLPLTDMRPILLPNGVTRMVKYHIIQLSYLVEVEGDGDNVCVNVDEYETSFWATKSDLDEIRITDYMRELAIKAFDGCL